MDQTGSSLEVFVLSKFSYEQKLAAVRLYLAGQSSGSIIKEFQIAEYAELLFWVKQYQRHGPASLRPSKTKSQYSSEFKLNALDWKKRYHETFEATALKFGLSSPATVYQWQKASDAGLLVAPKKKRGRPPLKQNRKSEKPLTDSERQELIKLRKENRALFIENEYLKKLDALIQKREQRHKNVK